MPMVKATATGSTFLEKTRTGADEGSTVALNLYQKMLGSEGTGNTIFSIGKEYSPGSNTLMVFVNGQKAELNPSGTMPNQYEETSVAIVTFKAPLQDDDIVEFMIPGAYVADEQTISILSPAIIPYPTNDDLPIADFVGNRYITNEGAVADTNLNLPLGAKPYYAKFYRVANYRFRVTATNSQRLIFGSNLGVVNGYVEAVEYGTVFGLLFNGIEWQVTLHAGSIYIHV